MWDVLALDVLRYLDVHSFADLAMSCGDRDLAIMRLDYSRLRAKIGHAFTALAPVMVISSTSRLTMPWRFSSRHTMTKEMTCLCHGQLHTKCVRLRDLPSFVSDNFQYAP